MKIADLKHNHSLTDLLKVLLFSILMLAPMISVGVRCGYVMINKNAKDSYSETNVQKIEQINNAQSYADTFTYNVKPLTTQHATSGAQYFSYISISNVNANAVYFKVYDNRTSSYQLRMFDSNDNIVQTFIWGNPNEQLNDFNEFYFTKESGENLFNFTNVFLIYETTEKLDNVFNYSVEKLANDQMFKWTENTPVYTGINAMCTQLGITAPAIPIIIAYWLILTCVYIVIDILLKLFTYITHLIGSKTA